MLRPYARCLSGRTAARLLLLALLLFRLLQTLAQLGEQGGDLDRDRRFGLGLRVAAVDLGLDDALQVLGVGVVELLRTPLAGEGVDRADRHVEFFVRHLARSGKRPLTGGARLPAVA